MSALSVAERVAAGVAWLDENRPGWVERINLDTLDLGDPCRCVLGQEYGNYYGAPTAAVMDEAIENGSEESWASVVRGFNTVAFDAQAAAEEFEELTAAWRVLIVARRALSS